MQKSAVTLNQRCRQSLGGSTGRLCKNVSLETAFKGIGGGGEPCIKRQIIPDCVCKVAEESFAKFSGGPWTIKKKLVS